MNALEEVGAASFAFGIVLGLAVWLVPRHLVPARRQLEDKIGTRGMGSKLAGWVAPVVEWTGSLAIAGGLLGVAADAFISKSTPLVGELTVPIREPHPLEVGGVGIVTLLAAIALGRISERAFGVWGYRLTYLSAMKINVEEVGALTISPRDLNQGRNAEAYLEIVGANFAIRPDGRHLVSLGPITIEQGVSLTGRVTGPQSLKIEFTDVSGKVLSDRSTTIQVVKYRWRNYVIPNRLVSLAAVFSFVFLILVPAAIAYMTLIHPATHN
jgi:hypothetical protein